MKLIDRCGLLCRIYLFDQLRRGGKYFSTTSSRRQDNNLLDSLYSGENKIKLLNFFNSLSKSQQQFIQHLRKEDVAAIIKHRQEYGKFESLSDLVKVPDLDVVRIQNACTELNKKDLSQLLQDIENPTATHQKVFPHPSMSATQRSEVNSLVALDVQTDRLTWAKINRSLEVTHWEQMFIFDRNYVPYDHVVYYKKIKEALNSLPDTDIYVMEKKETKVPSVRFVPYITSVRLIEAMIATMLHTDDNNRLFLIKHAAISKHFDLLVGNERVSGKQVVKNMINGKSNFNVVIPKSVAESYEQITSAQKERYAETLLSGIGFYNLVIFKS